MRGLCDAAACHAVATPGHRDAPQSATAAAPSSEAPNGAPLYAPVERGQNKSHAQWEEIEEAKGEGREYVVLQRRDQDLDEGKGGVGDDI